MHPYSINLRERQVVYFVLAAISFGASLLVGRTLAYFQWGPPSWLDVPGAFTIFGLLCWWFDKHIWRWSLVRWMGVATPILSGHWSGVVHSSFDDFKEAHPVTVTVRQTWTTMSVMLTSRQSNSHSTTAAINMGPDQLLVYSFTNEPEVGTVETMHIHVGTAALRISGDKLSGEYYSGRDRQNIGNIELHRTSGDQQSGGKKVNRTAG